VRGGRRGGRGLRRGDPLRRVLRAGRLLCRDDDARIEFSHRAADESLPLRDAFSVLFFVSVGMLFDPTILVSSPGKVRRCWR
jgi:predicted Kef-type K+ transport protein